MRTRVSIAAVSATYLAKQATTGVFTARALDEEPNAADALQRVIHESAREFSKREHPRGCMISTATLACATENEPVAALVAALRAGTTTVLRERIERGITDGDLRPDTDASALARYIGAIIQGMSVQARDGASRKDLAAIAAIACAEIERSRAMPAPI